MIYKNVKANDFNRGMRFKMHIGVITNDIFKKERYD